MTALLGSLLVGAAWTIVIAVVRPTYRLRRDTRWPVRPRVQAVDHRAFAAEAVPIVAAAGERLRAAGFEPFVTVRVPLGSWNGGRASQSQLTAVWRRQQSHDSAAILWQQFTSGRSPTWGSAIDLQFQRRLVPTGRRSTRLRLANLLPNGGGRLAWSTDPDEIGSTYATFAAVPQGSPTAPYEQADAAAYLAAYESLAAERVAAVVAGMARPDTAGEAYVYTWTAAMVAVCRHRFGIGRSRDHVRGFDVIPIASRADVD